MRHFSSDNSFAEFCDYVRKTARHFLDGNRLDFLETVRQQSKDSVHIVPMSTALWRAQIGVLEPGRRPRLDGRRSPLGKKRMKPKLDSVGEGRVNPKGIPCLYAATDEATAI